MQVSFGTDASKKTPVVWDSLVAVNGHILMSGMSGAGKTYTLRRLIAAMLSTSSRTPRVHVFDVHGDIEIEGCSSVMFSEQTQYGLNPLRVNPDPHFGGVRKRVRDFITTMNRVMNKLGPKQEAALRNILVDVYAKHGFNPEDPETWEIDESAQVFLSDGADGRLYIDVPMGEKDEAKALGARWDGTMKCWYIATEAYRGPITRWEPKRLARTHPSIPDALRLARHIMQKSFLGTGQQAIANLDTLNRVARNYQRKIIDALRQGQKGYQDEGCESDLDTAKEKAVAAYQAYAESIKTGLELHDIMRYDSTDVLKGVVDRLENLNAIGIFKPAPPPFDPKNPVWRYDIKALGITERKLFVLFRLEELFARAVQRGEQKDICEVIVLDEAHIYADDDPENIINTIAKEARKFGVGLICASQSPTHFTEDFISSVATKVILGIDEMYWKGAETKMRVEMKALEWIRATETMLVQIKTRGATRNEWQWTRIR